jgi:hypothetical protein
MWAPTYTINTVGGTGLTVTSDSPKTARSLLAELDLNPLYNKLIGAQGVLGADTPLALEGAMYQLCTIPPEAIILDYLTRRISNLLNARKLDKPMLSMNMEQLQRVFDRLKELEPMDLAVYQDPASRVYYQIIHRADLLDHKIFPIMRLNKYNIGRMLIDLHKPAGLSALYIRKPTTPAEREEMQMIATLLDLVQKPLQTYQNSELRRSYDKVIANYIIIPHEVPHYSVPASSNGAVMLSPKGRVLEYIRETLLQLLERERNLLNQEQTATEEMVCHLKFNIKRIQDLLGQLTRVKPVDLVVSVNPELESYYEISQCDNSKIGLEGRLRRFDNTIICNLRKNDIGQLLLVNPWISELSKRIPEVVVFSRQVIDEVDQEEKEAIHRLLERLLQIDRIYAQRSEYECLFQRKHSCALKRNKSCIVMHDHILP